MTSLLQDELMRRLFPPGVPIYYCPSLGALTNKVMHCKKCKRDLLFEHYAMVEREGVNLVPPGPGNTPGYGMRVTPLSGAVEFPCPFCRKADSLEWFAHMRTPRWAIVRKQSGEEFVAAFQFLTVVKGADEAALRKHKSSLHPWRKWRP